MPIEAVARVVRGLPAETDPHLLIGADGFGDAGVYRIADDRAIVVTADFFPPIVDDAYTYGQIAAANALSDVYATGAVPLTALNIVAFPDDELPPEVLTEILRGGAERVHAAGAVIAGGHSVRERSIQYGLAITGTVDPARLMCNRAARAGERLVLTKGLGTGFVTTAARGDRCPEAALEAAVASMVMLNRAASEIAAAHGLRAATDITGFGLAGHAMEMAQASAVTLRIALEALPILPGARPLMTARNRTRANATNAEHVRAALSVEGRRDPEAEDVLYDPQTSGGLLLSVPAADAEAIVRACRAAGAEQACIIGSVEESGPHRLVVEA